MVNALHRFVTLATNSPWFLAWCTYSTYTYRPRQKPDREEPVNEREGENYLISRPERRTTDEPRPDEVPEEQSQ